MSNQDYFYRHLDEAHMAISDLSRSLKAARYEFDNGAAGDVDYAEKLQMLVMGMDVFLSDMVRDMEKKDA